MTKNTIQKSDFIVGYQAGFYNQPGSNRILKIFDGHRQSDSPAYSTSMETALKNLAELPKKNYEHVVDGSQGIYTAKARVSWKKITLESIEEDRQSQAIREEIGKLPEHHRLALGSSLPNLPNLKKEFESVHAVGGYAYGNQYTLVDLNEKNTPLFEVCLKNDRELSSAHFLEPKKIFIDTYKFASFNFENAVTRAEELLKAERKMGMASINLTFDTEALDPSTHNQILEQDNERREIYLLREALAALRPETAAFLRKYNAFLPQ